MEHAPSRGRPLELAAVGTVGGLFSGLFGVRGGILFVPALTIAVGLTQVRAEATSLLAIIPVAAVGVAAQLVRRSLPSLRERRAG